MRKVAPLTQQQIESATPKEKEYNLGDGNGLYLFVRATGTKSWKYNYTHPYTKKRANLGLGVYPNVTLEQARMVRDEFNSLLANNIDPKKYRDAKKNEEAEINQYLFENLVNEWLKVKSSELKSIALKTITNSLENFILPFVATCSVKDINARLVMEVLQPVKDNGDPQVLMQNYLYFYQIMDHAKLCGLIDHNPLNKLNVSIDLG
ncbi:integrase arm-type DNA-binding domain-containing protein [Psychromonas sp.]|uniref:integrase arm-type DNA-binding domain-containing protein n=1 Tax=Psychromonas sp. TaxID=1884585 RepID=UPI0035659865